ncbi:MAG: endolytic transglycosylase MltG [Zoogloeaceae bacterium]|nr:endolytic transglycosylase MltG [Zoogloeaceae bacterium]
MRFLRYFLVLSVFFVALAAGAGGFWFSRPLAFAPDVAQVEFRVPSGMGLRGVARALDQAGVAVNPDMLALAARLSGRAGKVRTGVYLLASGSTPRDLLDLLASGKVLQVDVRLIEGWTFREWRQKIAARSDLAQVTTTLSDAELMARLGMTGQSPEGLFFPDTYRVDKFSEDLALFARAARAMREHLEREWREKEADLPYRSAYEALIMASIVEKETGLEADRSAIAGVFVNRLRLGMRLQTDPTVIYGLGAAFDGNLRRTHLEADTPYNTYTRAGLPPTPIAMPGLASLRAALHPARTRALYFVARGDGGSQFSTTLAEHNAAVDRYQRRRPRLRP